MTQNIVYTQMYTLQQQCTCLQLHLHTDTQTERGIVKDFTNFFKYYKKMSEVVTYSVNATYIEFSPIKVYP